MDFWTCCHPLTAVSTSLQRTVVTCPLRFLKAFTVAALGHTDAAADRGNISALPHPDYYLRTLHALTNVLVLNPKQQYLEITRAIPATWMLRCRSPPGGVPRASCLLICLTSLRQVADSIFDHQPGTSLVTAPLRLVYCILAWCLG
jgi:hypothetical protein